MPAVGCRRLLPGHAQPQQVREFQWTHAQRLAVLARQHPRRRGVGSVTEKGPFPAEERAAFPSLYCAIWPGLVALARELGYALLIHGSLSRDLDLVAVPWTDAAVPEEDLVEAIRAKCDAWVGVAAAAPGSAAAKPHGRRCWTLMLNGHAFIDLSVMPRAVPA